MRVQGMLETCLYAEDLEAAARFYVRVLGLEVYSREAGRHVFFQLGPSMFLLFDPRVTRDQQIRIGGGLVPAHGAEGPGHAAFVVAEADLAGWREKLANGGVAIESEVAWPKGGHSIYFRDPAGNCLELATPRLWRLQDAWAGG